MIRLNTFIEVGLELKADVSKSTFMVHSDTDFLNLDFLISSGDFLFDLELNNYALSINIELNYFNKYHLQSINFPKSPIEFPFSCALQIKIVDLLKLFSTVKPSIFKYEGLVLEVISMLSERMETSMLNCAECKFLNNIDEKNKIRAAHDYILSNFRASITIPNIAKLVGTNECYLKKGYKEMYGITIFQQIQYLRMTMALHLLQTTEYSVAEIATDLGYASISSFSSAFKQYYGYSASLLKTL